jgi:hypothetical protein
MKMYAVFSWDSEHGPIKSWDRLASVEIHNARKQPIAHGVHGAPPVEFLVGSPAIAADLRNRLKDHGIDPASIREGGVVAYEAIITASPEFFAVGSAADQQKRLADWTAAQVDFVTKRYGSHRVVSMVLHQDEQTPHIHAVVVPLKHGVDRRRRDLAARWGLDGQILSARGEWRQLQTDYGKAMAPLGLSRGEESSTRKHLPFAVVLADIEAERAAIRIREADLADRERAINDHLIRLRDGWKLVEERHREAKAARDAAVAIMKEASDRESEYQAALKRERELERQLAALRASRNRPVDQANQARSSASPQIS